MALSEKFIRKYLRMARQVGEDSNPCPSRHIGVVIVHPTENRILSTGYNGPPKGTPHTDDPEYLSHVVWPQLTQADKIKAGVYPKANEIDQESQFISMYAGSGKCPRRVLECPSGTRLELCSCEHGEKNGIFNASQNLHGAWMICWCGVPCWDCSKAIINSGIARVVCVHDGKPDYSPYSRWLLTHAGVIIEMRDINTFDVIEVIGPVGG